jgi:hypothetical protein
MVQVGESRWDSIRDFLWFISEREWDDLREVVEAVEFLGEGIVVDSGG